MADHSSGQHAGHRRLVGHRVPSSARGGYVVVGDGGTARRLSVELKGDPAVSSGGYLDLRTGEVLPELLFDPFIVGEDDAIDMDEEPDCWLELQRFGSRDGWRDMDAFAARQRRCGSAWSGRSRARVRSRRFRDLVCEEGLAEPWHSFSSDREQGRAREYLAGEGIRVGRPLTAAR